MRPRTLRIVERWLKAAETQWGAAPHRPGRSQGRTLVLSLIYGADSTAAGRVAVHASREVESLRRSCPVPHGAADTAAAFHILPSTADTCWGPQQEACTRSRVSTLGSGVA